MTTVVGIGADGWLGLTTQSQRELAAAKIIRGSGRQLALLPGDIDAELRPWPTPLIPALDRVASDDHVLASGDPMFFGIGSTLARYRPDLTLRVLPHVSSFTLACARMAWPTETVTAVSAVAREPNAAVAALRAGKRVVVLSESAATPDQFADLLRTAELAPDLTVLEQLGGSEEHVAPWRRGAEVDDLNVIAAAPTAAAPTWAFEHDGQITKPDVRALTVAALVPSVGRIWDLGAGSGSVGIAWAQAAGGSVEAVERRPDRAERIVRNAARAGVAAHVTVGDTADVDELVAGLAAPIAVFVGGGLTAELADACVSALPIGGRLVANTVTVEGHGLAAALCARFGGELRSYSIADRSPLGSGTAWQPRRPIVQWVLVKGSR